MKKLLLTLAVVCLGALVSGATYINGVESAQSLTVSTATITQILGPTRVGDAGTTSHSLTANDDLYVSGKFEVDGVVSLDEKLYTFKQIYMQNDQPVSDANSKGAFVMNQTPQTPDTTFLGVNVNSNAILISEIADYNTDFAHALATNPTVFIQSADATDVTQWLSLSHDQTNGVIDVGKGKLTTPDAFQAADFYSGDGTQGATDSTSFWLCTAADCSTKCQVTIKDGLITSCT